MEEMTMVANTCVLFDRDGCMDELAGSGTPKFRCPELALIIGGMRRSRIAFAMGTGASHESAQATVSQLLSVDPDAQCDVLSASYCVQATITNGRTRVVNLAPDQQIDELRRLHDTLEQIREEHKGVLTDTVVHTAFYPCGETFDGASNEKSRLVADNSHVRLAANRCDFGNTVMPRVAGKQLVVDWLLSNGYQIMVAAGDSASDAPMLEAALFPIVTVTSEGGTPNATLAEIVHWKKCGYIADGDNPHAHGLICGLHAARQGGYVTF